VAIGSIIKTMQPDINRTSDLVPARPTAKVYRFSPVVDAKLPKLTAAEAKFFAGFRLILAASAAGKPVTFEAGGSPVRMSDIRGIKVGYRGGQWSFEMPRYVWHKSLAGFSIAGQSLAWEVERAGLSDEDRTFFGRIKLIMQASAAGKLVHVDGRMGLTTKDGSSGVDVRDVHGTTVSLANGSWSLVLPTHVAQTSFASISIEA
jgi:hypothetical protein